jgi:hypothetical protein
LRRQAVDFVEERAPALRAFVGLRDVLALLLLEVGAPILEVGAPTIALSIAQRLLEGEIFEDLDGLVAFRRRPRARGFILWREAHLPR